MVCPDADARWNSDRACASRAELAGVLVHRFHTIIQVPRTPRGFVFYDVVAAASQPNLTEAIYAFQMLCPTATGLVETCEVQPAACHFPRRNGPEKCRSGDGPVWVTGRGYSTSCVLVSAATGTPVSKRPFQGRGALRIKRPSDGSRCPFRFPSTVKKAVESGRFSWYNIRQLGVCSPQPSFRFHPSPLRRVFTYHPMGVLR